MVWKWQAVLPMALGRLDMAISEIRVKSGLEGTIK